MLNMLVNNLQYIFPFLGIKNTLFEALDGLFDSRMSDVILSHRNDLNVSITGNYLTYTFWKSLVNAIIVGSELLW